MVQIYVVLTQHLSFVAQYTHLMIPFLPSDPQVEKILVHPFLLLILVNLVIHPGLQLLQSLILLLIQGFPVNQVIHQNLYLP
jgi:hypothetical protein